MEEKTNHNKKFWIHPDDFNKVINYAAASYNEFKAEIGGQMIVEQDKDGDYILKDPEIIKQEVSGGECDLDATELAFYYSRNAKKYGDNVRFCWWHSHHTMGAFWSGTDDSTILSNKAKDWSVSLVVNLKKEYKLRIQFFEPFLHEVNVELNFLTEESEVTEDILKEVKDKCTPQAVNLTQYYNNGQGSLGFDHNYNGYGVRTKEHFNRVGIPYQVLRKAEDEIEETLDQLAFFNNPKEALNTYNNAAKTMNKKYKKYNFRLKVFKTPEELETASSQFWTDEYFENRKKGAVA
tara:strand:+ start:2344 stop:3222 length:879 start_codon:yes stop_codon:yes gene_type:complete